MGERGVPYFVINGRAILTHKSSTFSNKIRGVLHLVNYLDNGYENVKITKVNIQESLGQGNNFIQERNIDYLK